jgi:hypothetical protein
MTMSLLEIKISKATKIRQKSPHHTTFGALYTAPYRTFSETATMNILQERLHTGVIKDW